METSGSSLNEEEEDCHDYQEWGLHKGMELFEVSAKDDLGGWIMFCLLNVTLDKTYVCVTIRHPNSLRLAHICNYSQEG